MRLIESFKNKKLILFNIFLTLYVSINLLGGERGLASYFEKKKIHQELIQEEIVLNEKLQDLKHKIKLIMNNDLDYLDMLYREKLRYGTKDEILIKLKWVLKSSGLVLIDKIEVILLSFDLSIIFKKSFLKES